MNSKKVLLLILLIPLGLLLTSPIVSEADSYAENNTFVVAELVSSDDIYEPNDDYLSANETFSGFYYDLNCSDDDWYYVNVSAGNTLIVEINFTHALGNLELSIFGPSSQILPLDESVSSTDNEMCYYNVTSTDDYYIFVDKEGVGSNIYGMNITIISGSIQSRSLTMINPTASSIWGRGCAYEINWTSTGIIDEVDISIGSFTAGLIANITYNCENNGSYLWEVPSTIPILSNYMILIMDSLSGVFVLSEQFSVIDIGITIISPTFSSIWNNGSIYNINWTTTGDTDAVDIDLYNSTGFLENLGDDIPNNGSIEWLVGDYNSGTDYFINITNSYNATINAVSDNFVINNTASSIEIIILTNPRSTSTFYKGSTYEITWVWSGIFRYVNITLHDETGLVAIIATNVTNSGSYSMTVSDTFTNGEEYHLEIFDTLDNTPLGKSDNFTITEQPYIEGRDDDKDAVDSNVPDNMLLGLMVIGGIILIGSMVLASAVMSLKKPKKRLKSE